ncbi:TRAP transporter small permease [Phreatobacter aquaticus]|uniref:TRAP transporter small permease protein n=1 Tax=Phreatobacter aquaticus TaxID=2570229 RepID=A0A4D7QF71_9HYPH|nr:TRAP transporter small permease [Phreatobacter aquaticus]QCK84439.1 TRAP transporter small permease [Phreatobacter aquaticus]
MVDQTIATHTPLARPYRLILAASTRLLAVERLLIMGFMYLLTALILLNVATRYARVPIYWIDESAVYSVVWLTFIGASAMTRLRLDFAVSMLTERLSERGAMIAKVLSTLAVIIFGLALMTMCWLWMDPVGLARAGFDAREFAGQTFNFLYTERTQTLGWPTWSLYLIMPIFAVSMTIHGLANLIEDLELAPKASHPSFVLSAVDGVN